MREVIKDGLQPNSLDRWRIALPKRNLRPLQITHDSFDITQMRRVCATANRNHSSMVTGRYLGVSTESSTEEEDFVQQEEVTTIGWQSFEGRHNIEQVSGMWKDQEGTHSLRLLCLWLVYWSMVVWWFH